MGKEKLKQDRFSKIEIIKEQFTLVPRGDSPDNTIGGTMYSSQYNSSRTSTIVRRHNTWLNQSVEHVEIHDNSRITAGSDYKTGWCPRTVHKTIGYLSCSCSKLKSKIIEEEGM